MLPLLTKERAGVRFFSLLTIMTTTKKPKHWELIWQLIRYKPKLYILDSIYWILIMGLPALPGLIIREFFNRLTNETQLGLSPLALIALLLALNLGHIVVIFTVVHSLLGRKAGGSQLTESMFW